MDNKFIERILQIISSATNDIYSNVTNHTLDKKNPHSVTKAQIGLGNVNNTSDANKPVSVLQQAALDALYQQATAYTQQKIADLIDGAPETMNTIKEVHDAIVSHKTIIDALDAAIGKKASAAEFDSHVKDTDVHFSATERTKLAGIATGANNYIHPTTAGNKHIPSGGSSGQILRWSADGTAVWGADNNTTYPIYQKAIAADFATKFRTQTKGNTSAGDYISTVRCEVASVANAPQFGTGLAWGRGDTHGYLGTSYSSAEAYLGSGNADKLNWVKKLAFADGTGASGTWGISVSGNAATATKLATARSVRTNLASTSAVNFDGSANITPGVTGTLPLGNGGTGATTAAGALDALLAGVATKGFTTSKATNTYLAGNQGQAIINSSAGAGAYVMLAKMNSTNGYFTHGSYQGNYLLQYTAKSTVTAGTNSVTKSVTLLNEAGNTSFPGTVSASAFSGNASSASKLGTNAGSATQPVYFSGGVPVACTYSLAKSVPSNAVFTDTTYTAASAAPNMDGTAAVGTSAKYAREDHVHPVDTSRAAASHTHSYLPLSGGTVTGNVKFGSAAYAATISNNIITVKDTSNLYTVVDSISSSSGLGSHICSGSYSNRRICNWVNDTKGYIQLYQNGGWTTVGGSTGSSIAISDVRLKENISDSDINALDIIRNIQFRQFDWKDDTGRHQNLGIVIDELELLAPELKGYGTGGTQLDFDGNEVPNFKQVDNLAFTSYIGKGLQELIDIVEKQKDEINELKDKINELMN